MGRSDAENAEAHNAELTAPTLAEIRAARIEREYRELGARDPELFESCIRAASAIAMNRDLSVEIAADIEAALVGIAREALREVW